MEIFCWQLLVFLGDIPLPLGTFLQCAIFLIKMNVLEALKLFLKIQGLGLQRIFCFVFISYKAFLKENQLFYCNKTEEEEEVVLGCFVHR